MRTQERHAHIVTGKHLNLYENCDELIRLVKLLELSPLHTITSQTFIERFRLLVNAADTYFLREEEMLGVTTLPNSVKQRYLASHRKIRDIFYNIHIDSLKGRNQTAIEIYDQIGAEMERHLSELSTDLKSHMQSFRH
ncbi:hypothetical protein [Propionivibrio dicarboxylicus]|uniref:Hemerythrin-like domain-containing protein n=1 Tax=Propionivibrio dicarboxylicus TaxID=83767 RepID=A0A1G8EQJ5_9RHOO|nr:hypothetical protein [Propionivibrio dicarboxylicus]SDH72107.1 hypothetical protein SAMN05660652_02161 [Propionivibrio dicarboxylicus]